MKKIRMMIWVLFATAALVMVGKGGSKAHAEVSEWYCSFNKAEISGRTGENLSGQVTNMYFRNKTLAKAIPEGKDISDWFSGKTSPRPAGMKVVVKEDAEVGANYIVIEFKGYIYGASQDNIAVNIPGAYFDEELAGRSIEFEVGTTKYNITRDKLTVPSGYYGAGPGIYFQAGANGKWKLNGKKGEELTGICELNVLIDGCFIKPLSKNTDISSWFTGHIWAQNNYYNTSKNSMLPPGITAKVKDTVKVGDNSFTIVFSGTPTKGSEDLVAITVPAGYLTYCHGSSQYKGDLSTALKTTNASGNFVYDIESPDNDYKSSYVLITYPDVTVHAGELVKQEDGLIATYQLVGTDESGEPIKFKTVGGVKVGQDLTGYTVQDIYTQRYSYQVQAITGLEPTITKISDDWTSIEVTFSGIVDNPGFFPYVVECSGQLNTYTTANRYLDFVTSQDTQFIVDEPDPQITMDKDILMTSTFLDEKATVSDYGTFKLYIANDKLAKEFKDGAAFELFTYTTTDNYGRVTEHSSSTWNGLSATVDYNTPVGSRTVYIRLTPSQVTKDYYGEVRLALPKEYLQKATEYGNKSLFDLEESRLFADVEKYENYTAKASDVKLEGRVRYARLLGDVEYLNGEGETMTYRGVLKSIHNGIGSGRVSFTVETLKNIHVSKDYAAGASVKDLVRILEPDRQVSPFQYRGYGTSGWSYNTYWENLYDIHTVNAIAKDADGEFSSRTLQLYIDLSEVKALQASSEKLNLQIKNGPLWEKVYTSNKCVYDITGEQLDTEDPEEMKEYEDEQNGNGSSGSSGIDYDSHEDVIIYASDADGETQENTYINLCKETFSTDMSIACYSLDGGNKWKAATSVSEKLLASLLKKGGTLVIANNYDSSQKKPADTAVKYTFTTLKAAPKATKLKAEYESCRDDTGETTGGWMLAGTDLKPISPDELKKLEIAVADTTGKKPDDSGYGLWPKAGGIEVPELSGEKVASKVYLIRTAPTSDTPAGKPLKLKVKGQQKAPKLKIDYKKEILKGKENICVSAGGEMLAQNLTKEAAKAGVDISESLTEGSRISIKVWIGASAKKAATAVQTIEAAARAAAPVSGTALTVTDGKFKLDKKYEVYNEAKQKWGGLPKITSSCTLRLRVKADAKGGKESDSTYAASAPVNLIITYGVVDEEKNKQGVISAVIEEIEDTD